VPIGAASREQANLCFGAASAMVKNGPLAEFFDVFQYEMQFKDGRPGRMYRIAAEAGTQDGSLPTCFVADEVHEWVDSKARVHTVVTNSLQKRSPSLEVNITTAGDPVKSELLLSLYEYGRKVRAGEVFDPSFYFLWFEPSGSVSLDVPDELRAAILEANPSSWVDVERLARRVEVEGIKESVFRRYHLNQWVTSGDPFLETAVWDGLARSVNVEHGSRVVVGFDGSYNGDSTSLVGVTLDTDLPHVFEVQTWERPEVAADDWRIPRYEVDAAVESLFLNFEVVELVCDPARWTLYMDEWISRFGDDRVISYPNVVERMTPATAKFHDAVQAGLLTHDGSPRLRRHVQNAVTKANARGYVVRKDHPNRKIDALIAALMAHDRATWRRDEETEVSAELW
jgi:phage terminase large subunit-like protein